MTTSFALKIFFEIGLVMLIAYGYKNEDKLIEFEAELFAFMKFAFKKYILKNNNKKTSAKTASSSRKSVSAQKSVPVKADSPRRRVRAEIKSFPVSASNRNVA